jgi:hypothetical protein
MSLPLPADPKTKALDPPTIFLSDKARGSWIEFHNDVERELGRMGQFGDVADFAAKAAENAARIAGVSWVLERGSDGEIDVETMQAAAAVASWHLHEAKRIIGATKVPQAVADAMLLVEWMQKPAMGGASRYQISPREVLHEGPSGLRDKTRRDAAAEVLIKTNHLFETQKGSGTLWTLNPKLRRKSSGSGA